MKSSLSCHYLANSRSSEDETTMRRNKKLKSSPNEGVFLTTTATSRSPPSTTQLRSHSRMLNSEVQNCGLIMEVSSSAAQLSSEVSSFRSLAYDVFLSFRGKDTRKIFVDHLYTYLVQLGIHTYRDDKTLHKGDCIHPSLMKAIEESQIAVVVFSENYGDSSSCLRELEYIMECKDEGRLIVIPVFYGVVPSDVREQTGKFGEGFAKQVLKNSVNIESCRKALEDAGLISGWEPKHMASGHESVATREIANTIFRSLRLTPNANEGPVGIDTRMQDFESCLKVGSSDAHMIGIWGLGGGGKTTIASYVYNKLFDKFESRCFVRNIRETSNKYGLEKLQEKVIFDILDLKVTPWSVEDGIYIISSRLRHKKVLIVLDDVACHEHLDALAGSRDWFGKGSLIIITTRDKHLLNAHKVDATYNITLLDEEEALKLFHRHTLWYSKPEEDLGELTSLSQNAVSYANGLPLALKVLGQFLCDKDVCESSSALTRLEDIPDEDFVKKLKISYDSLKPVEQELFLDIACVFRHWPKDEAMMILDACGFYPVVGVRVLLQKALISITDGTFDMHDVIQEMGYSIVRGKHANSPEKHSRLWRIEDIENICTSAATMENNKIQVLHSPYGVAPSNLLEVLANMKKLRLINVRQVVKKVVEEPPVLSNGLRWISWEGYPARWLPTNFQPTKLVGLKLKNGLQEKLWVEFKYIPSLKVLDLQGSCNLITTPDFSGLPNLETLVLSGCKSLREIHSSIGSHVKLVCLDLADCKELEMFPPIIAMHKLETLVLSGCSKLVNFPDIRQTMDSLKHLNMAYTGINVVPSSIGEYCTNLESVCVIGCNELVSIQLGSLRSLKSIQGRAKSNGILSISVGGC